MIIAAELLKNADELVKQKIHPTSIIAGYRLACKEAVKYIHDHLTYKVSVKYMLDHLACKVSINQFFSFLVYLG